MTNEDLLASAQTLLDTLPELAVQSDVTDIAVALQNALEAAVAQTVTIG